MRSDPWPVEAQFATSTERTGFAFDARIPPTHVPDQELDAPAVDPERPDAVDEPTDEPVPEPPVTVTEIPRQLLATGAELVVWASVDIGANSVHLLVAACRGHQLDPLLDESVFLGLGDRVAKDGYLGSAAREDLIAALASYAEAARNLGAREIVLMGTEPIRRAADAAILVFDVEARTGLPLHVLDHHEEGILTLAGVTMGRSAGREIMVVDIGGGSSEIVVAAPGTPVRTIGLPLGSARMTQDHVRSDPATMDEIDAMVVEARRVIAEAPDASPEEMIAVGGTASNLLRILPGTVSDGILTSRRVTIALAMLTVESSADMAARHGLRHTRARILPAGAVIVDAILDRYGVDRLRVSEASIREGAILVAAIAGNAWRDRLPALAEGWES